MPVNSPRIVLLCIFSTCTHCVGHALFVHAPLVGCPVGDCTWLIVLGCICPGPSSNNNNRETSNQVCTKSQWSWLLNGNVKKEMEATVLAAQEQALSTNAIKANIFRMLCSPKCRLCGCADETVDHLVSSCSYLVQREYKGRHDAVASLVHWRLAKEVFGNVGGNIHLVVFWMVRTVSSCGTLQLSLMHVSTTIVQTSHLWTKDLIQCTSLMWLYQVALDFLLRP